MSCFGGYLCLFININIQVLPNDMLDFLDAPVPYIVEAAKGFLKVLRLYLDSLCSNLRSHTITNVQSNDDKVSLLLKESFIESFPSHDRPFLKVFVETQFFSVHTDLVLSFFQKE
ncbi:hypothetical protein SDJN02_18031, partial [Cucurbita argyrosperma subsp. argyrosperma]